MLYELIAIVRPGNLAEVKDIARVAGAQVLNGGGVIRSLTNWGVSTLPKRTRKHQATHENGHYFVMRFDSSPTVQETVKNTLGLDPRMIKFSSVKIGGKTLEEMSKIGSKVEWSLQDREQ